MHLVTSPQADSRLLERHDLIRIEEGTLIVQCDQHYQDGRNETITLRVTPDDEICLERQNGYMRGGSACGFDAHVAMHLRMAAVPLLANPLEGVANGVDLLVATAERHTSVALHALN